MLVTYSGYRVYKRMKTERKNLTDMLSLPMFEGQSVEVSLLGGLASVKVGKSHHVEYEQNHTPLRLEDPTAAHVKELGELARLYEKNLITLEEYNQTKAKLLNGKSIS